MRKITASVARKLHSVKIAMVRLTRFEGSTKLGIYPAGGAKAGPLSSLSLNLTSVDSSSFIVAVILTILAFDKTLNYDKTRALSQKKGTRFYKRWQIVEVEGSA